MITTIMITGLICIAIWAVHRIVRWFGIKPDPQDTSRGRG